MLYIIYVWCNLYINSVNHELSSALIGVWTPRYKSELNTRLFDYPVCFLSTDPARYLQCMPHIHYRSLKLETAGEDEKMLRLYGRSATI